MAYCDALQGVGHSRVGALFSPVVEDSVLPPKFLCYNSHYRGYIHSENRIIANYTKITPNVPIILGRKEN